MREALVEGVRDRGKIRDIEPEELTGGGHLLFEELARELRGLVRVEEKFCGGLLNRLRATEAVFRVGIFAAASSRARARFEDGQRAGAPGIRLGGSQNVGA